MTRTLTHGQLLRALGGSALTSGAYSPATTERRIVLGSAPSPALDQMVSLHEAYHAFLNASTTFGVSMILVGAMLDAQKPGFEEMLSEMIDRSTETHETYATVFGLMAATRGDLGSDLLAPFPDYARHLTRFLDDFGAGRQLAVAMLLLSNAARAAMQTPLYDALLACPPERWPQIELEVENDPDLRFSRIVDSAILARAAEAARRALADRGGEIAALADEATPLQEQWRLFSLARPDDLGAADHAAFGVFAAHLDGMGFRRPHYDMQKDKLPDLQAIVMNELGTRTQQRFFSPEGIDEDLSAVLLDFRREILTIREGCLPLIVTDLVEQDPDAIAAFEHSGSAGRHHVCVALPIGKASRLFSFDAAAPALHRAASDHLTGLRRLAHGSDGALRVEMLLVDPTVFERHAQLFSEADLFCLASLATIRDPQWRRVWLEHDTPSARRLAVLIDDDPFVLLDDLASGASPVEVFGFKARFPLAEATPLDIDVITMVVPSEPNVLFFTPCTSSLRMAILRYAEAAGDAVSVSDRVPPSWETDISRWLFNLIKEEGTFGAGFW